MGYGPVLVQMGAGVSLDSPGVAVWSKPAPAPVGAPREGSPMVGDPTRGEQLFPQGASGAPACVACHTVDATKKAFGPSLAGIATRAADIVTKPTYSGKARTASDFLAEFVANPDTYVSGAYPKGAMYRDYGKLLTTQQMGDLVAYLMTLE